jgi:hypothetical protein
MGWPDVADSAVKIGLGALVGGAFSVVVARVVQRHELRKMAIERRWTLLQETQLEVTSFGQLTSEYRARVRNAAAQRDRGSPVTPEAEAELAELRRRVFSGFSALDVPRSKLLLLGEKEAAEALGSFRVACDLLFRIAIPTSAECTIANLDARRDEIVATRDTTFEKVARAYLRV